MPAGQRDHYSVLGLLRDASLDEIRRAYLDAARRLHPDRNVAAGDTELFLEVQQAYEVLSNDERRAAYDRTLPPAPEAHPALRHQVLFSRPHLYEIDEPQVIHALLQVAPREQDQALSAPPLNLCLLLDRSSSMKGQKLDMAKSASIQLMRSLRPEDICAIVAFSDRAEILIPAGDRGDRRQQENRIQMLQTSGSTEILQGLRAATSEVRRSLNAPMVHHIILLTDGHTYGDEQGSLELAEEAAGQGIGITAMGIGNGWNDAFLDRLTSRTGGTSGYISKPVDIQRLLVDKFSMLARVYADNVILELNDQPDIEIRDAFRLQPEGGPIEIRTPWRIGPILQDAPLQMLLEIIVQPAALARGTVVLLDGTLRVSAPHRVESVPPLRLRLTRDVESIRYPTPPPDRILRALSAWTLYRIQERAQGAADSGDFEGAARSLEHVAGRLRSDGQKALANASLVEARNLLQERRWSESGRKEVKYGTRSLLLTDAADGME